MDIFNEIHENQVYRALDTLVIHLACFWFVFGSFLVRFWYVFGSFFVHFLYVLPIISFRVKILESIRKITVFKIVCLKHSLFLHLWKNLCKINIFLLKLFIV